MQVKLQRARVPTGTLRHHRRGRWKIHETNNKNGCRKQFGNLIMWLMSPAIWIMAPASPILLCGSPRAPQITLFMWTLMRYESRGQVHADYYYYYYYCWKKLCLWMPLHLMRLPGSPTRNSSPQTFSSTATIKDNVLGRQDGRMKLGTMGK